jgi:hypothetical protein
MPPATDPKLNQGFVWVVFHTGETIKPPSLFSRTNHLNFTFPRDPLPAGTEVAGDEN